MCRTERPDFAIALHIPRLDYISRSSMAANVRGQYALAKRRSKHDDIEMVAGLRIFHPVRTTK